MLINLRNALMAGKRLPYDAELEYLESTGTQYIDTPVVWNPFTTKVTATFSTTITAPQYIFGSYGSAHNFIGTRNVSGSMQILPAAGLSSTFGDIHTVSAYNVSRTYYEILDGAGVTISNANSNTTNTLSIFRINGVTTNIFNGRIYRLYLTDIATGQITADYIPVRKGTVGYLYDRVSGKLFGNEGTGDFVLGPDVVPVEYIESRSNYAQVIDTGFYANQNTKALITFEKLGADGWLFGSRNGSSSATDKFGIFVYQSPDGKISAQVGNTYIEPIISGGLTNRKKTIELSLADGVTVDGETIATFSESQKSQTFTSTYPMALFNMRVSSSGFNSGIYCRVYAYQIFGNGLIARNFLPVRVGTEGALIDTITRRIYRNAGTGAFTYGNDLKYPIPAE